ncbi:DUF916 and DUF3324 domain-containing protein [Enterococcus pallens]|uniref:Uncharacterized protein n=1 Tax=Enterococcus pallens ATCC BAA-351 TaxID=1158607 RepID=R2Q2K3_9ENTE|nr:DUF916 and DUF3324 domain-containing protein [Enterococcus pallens]EOH90797.1 hypothetical protein UAU_03336 [Enterococcus pallens ATCC BAA-351]EOU15993.1 hypothetical protein I588_03649 [Enterococcus pallens ATCC BAA-351]
MRHMKTIKTLVLGCILLIGSCLFAATSSYAEKEPQGGAGYTVESIIPENQVDKKYTFFYLKTTPEQPQTIEVKVKSTQKDPVTVKVAVHDAVSSSIGEIDYAQPKPKLDKSLTNPITSFVKVKDDVKEVTVENFEEKIVAFEITPPKDTYPGVKLGSIRFLREAEESESDQTGLVPEFARVIAVMLTEDEEAFDHGAELHLKNVGLTLFNGRKIIAANIQNDQPKVLQEMTITGKVTRKGEKEVLAEQEQSNFAVAPNSNFDFQLPLGIERFTPGTYVFTGEATGDGRTWKWDEEFTVGQKQADKVNEETVFKVVVPAWVPWTAAGLLAALIGLVAYLVRRQHQWLEGRK